MMLKYQLAHGICISKENVPLGLLKKNKKKKKNLNLNPLGVDDCD